jgi:predicted metal-dependent hydrolase
MQLSYILRRSAKAKSLRIVVKPGKIEVISPVNVSERQIKAFVESQQNWINDAVKRLEEKIRAIPVITPLYYEDGVSIPFQGNHYRLSVDFANRRRAHIQFQGEHFKILIPTGLDKQESADLVKLVLTKWMKNQARLQAETMIAKHAPVFELYPRSLRIKTQKSRWGSCGPKNDINLNWLLILAPAAILEYVVVHELCHIRYKNHSKDFWRLVAMHLPDYLQSRLWLKQYGASLMRGL